MIWKGFQRPKRLEVDSQTLTDTFGKFWAQPYERGFGMTIGNAIATKMNMSAKNADSRLQNPACSSGRSANSTSFVRPATSRSTANCLPSHAMSTTTRPLPADPFANSAPERPQR